MKVEPKPEDGIPGPRVEIPLEEMQALLGEKDIQICLLRAEIKKLRAQLDPGNMKPKSAKRNQDV